MSLLSLASFGQRGYYVKDGKFFSGVQLINDPDINPNFCQINTRSGIKRLSPQEVDEYGFNGGSVYKSFTIRLDSVSEEFFFKRLVKGKICLYTITVKGNRKKLFIQRKDSANLIELPKDKAQVREILRKYLSESPEAVEMISGLRNTERSIARLLKHYNSD